MVYKQIYKPFKGAVVVTRTKKRIKSIPEQAGKCKFYISGKCDITKKGEMICESKGCTLFKEK